MPNLYETSIKVRALEFAYNDSEDEAEASNVLAQLLKVDLTFEELLEMECRIVKNILSDVEAFKVEEEQLLRKRQAAESRADRLKSAMKAAMEKAGIKSAVVGVFKPRIQVNGGLPAITLADGVPIESLPEKFRTVKVVYDLDRSTIASLQKERIAYAEEFTRLHPEAETTEFPEELVMPDAITVFRGTHLRIA
jgi:hypothetical protein